MQSHERQQKNGKKGRRGPRAEGIERSEFRGRALGRELSGRRRSSAVAGVGKGLEMVTAGRLFTT